MLSETDPTAETHRQLSMILVPRDAPGTTIEPHMPDFLIRPLSSDQAADTLEVIEDRSQRRATIITSQLPVAHWHEAMGDETLADAILDRLSHNLHRVELRGESMRSADAPTTDLS